MSSSAVIEPTVAAALAWAEPPGGARSPLSSPPVAAALALDRLAWRLANSRSMAEPAAALVKPRYYLCAPDERLGGGVQCVGPMMVREQHELRRVVVENDGVSKRVHERAFGIVICFGSPSQLPRKRTGRAAAGPGAIHWHWDASSESESESRWQVPSSQAAL